MTIPPEGYALLHAIAIGENNNPLDYNELVGGGHFEGYDQFPQWAGMQFSAGISHAAGRYQFEPATWNEQAAKLNLTDFTPGSQDIAAWDLAQTVYRERMKRDLSTDLKTNVTAYLASALHSTWTSIQALRTGDRFRGAYIAILMAQHG